MVAWLAIDAASMKTDPRVARRGTGSSVDPSVVCRSALMKIQTLEDFARPQDLAALRGVVSRLVIRFPENGEILDLIKAEYRAGRPLPAIEKAVAARIETGEALPHTLAKAQRDHLRKIRGDGKIMKST
jgi:hypothetical protein